MNIITFGVFVFSYILTTVNSTDIAYTCNVDNCKICSGPGFCGLCETNYILAVNFTSGAPYCSQVICNINNCHHCLENNYCEHCANGYNVTSVGQCVANGGYDHTCPNNCISCYYSNQCSRCAYGYNLQAGQCLPNNGDISNIMENCYATFTGFTCQICRENYMVYMNYLCLAQPNFGCNSENCISCSSNNYCSQCQGGYQPDSDGVCEAIDCGIDNCLECKSTNTSLCNRCQTGYILSSTNEECLPKYYPCDVQNCKTCASMPNMCSQCELGYGGSSCTKYLGSSVSELDVYEQFYYPVQNCELYGPMIPGTSILTIGCKQCMEGFVNAAGYCVANLTLNNYQCNIAHCAYCTQNNYCGQCEDGYIAYLGYFQKCIKMFSTQKNCKLTSILGSLCSVCNQGFVLINDYQCVPAWPTDACQVDGCQYCIEQGQCQQCQTGFKLNNNSTCDPICTIDNCQRCSTGTTCASCVSGFIIDPKDNSKCINASTSLSDCSEYGSQCKSCNYVNCTDCNSDYTLYGNTCCETPAHDVFGCSVYQSSCSNRCIQCQIGFNLVEIPFFNFSSQCLNVPCGINNCAYCFGSSDCLVCMEGYTIGQDGQCVNYTQCGVENCEVCKNQTYCSSCLPGYHRYKGQCVCPFQNCLKCMGNQYCTVCAYPMVVQGGIGGKGCLPEVVPYTNCNITNCVQCQNQWYCAVCENGFSLTADGKCSQNLCDVNSNCALCGVNNTQCYLCTQNHFQPALLSKSCDPVPKNYSCFVFGCQFCKTSTTCEKCYDLFYLGNDGICHENGCTDNCLACFANNTCSVCLNGYYRSKNSRNQISCLPINKETSTNCSGIQYCIHCKEALATTENRQCLACYPGMMPNSDGSKCIPQDCQAQNCNLCMLSNQKLCLFCQQGYYLNPYYQCVPYNLGVTVSSCDVYNCLVCSNDNTCAKCLIGWNRTSNGTCVTNKFCDVTNCGNCTDADTCYNCAANFTFSSPNRCTPICNIDNCEVCNSSTTCLVCQNKFEVSSDKKSCVCPNTFVKSTNTCICPTNFTEFNNVCYNCTTPGNCSVCSSDNTCQTCNNTFVKVNEKCVCPTGFTFTSDKTCICPSGSTIYDDVCYKCEIELCSNCSDTNFCEICVNNLKVITSSENDTSCGCPEDFKKDLNNTCQCKQTGFKPNQEYQECYQCDISNCMFCSEDDFCSDCNPSYTRVNSSSCQCDDIDTQYKGYCYLCENDHCQVCNSTNYCMTCDDTYVSVNGTCQCPVGYIYNSNTDTCIECKIANCTSCSAANNCTSCQPTYNQVNSSLCLSCNLTNCKTCSSPDYCSVCEGTLDVSVEGIYCVDCSINNCLQCYGNSSCAICKSGYYIAADYQICVQCSTPGCAICSDNNFCSRCFYGYTLDTKTGKCSICQYPCLTCSSNGGCQTCSAPFSYSPTSNGTCFTCTVQNCATCNQTNTSQCLTCAYNYSPDGNGGCIYDCQDIYCLSCLFGSCSQCSPGFSPQGTGCNRCSSAPQCLQCSPTDLQTCYLCADGYYAQKGVCTKCPYSYCKTCNANSCLTFKESTGLFGVSINNKVYLTVCDPGCASCSSTNPSNCETCMTGFFYNDGNCGACSGNCKTCSSSNSSFCYTCYSNANLVKNSCVTCAKNCLTCNSTQCLSCVKGLTLSSSNQCTVSCPAFCETCSSSTSCTICQSGYSSSSNGTCLPCLSSCRECAGSAPGLCLNCGTGFYLSQQGSCSACPGNCTTCNFGGCVQCNPGFQLNYNFGCSVICAAPCLTCSSISPTVCFSCISGYKYVSSTNKCEPSPLVIDGVYYYCPFGQILMDNACKSCTSSSNCARCEESNLTACTSCSYGYYLNTDNTCTKCPKGCASCTSANNCITCDSSYVLPAQTVQSQRVCQLCESPCKTCFNSPTTCSSCDFGFTLSGWKCVGTFNIAFDLELSVSLQGFYEKYYEFLLSLANAVDSDDIGLVQITNLNDNQDQVSIALAKTTTSSGNTYVDGNITITSSPDNSQTKYQNLQTLLGNGSTIAGMTIANSQLAVNGGDIPDNSNNGPNLGLILGICIPVGVILIGILVYFLCIRKQNLESAPVNYTVNTDNNTTGVRQTFQLTREDPV